MRPEKALAVLARLQSKLAIVALRVLSVVAGLAYVKTYTGALTLDEVGAFFYLSTLSYALNALVFLPIDSYMQARVAALDTLPGPAILRLILATLAAGLGACVVVSAPFVVLHKLQLADLPWLYAVAALLYLCTSLRNLLNIRGGSVFVSVMLLMESIGRLLAFVLMAAVLGRSARTLMVSSALALALEFALILWRCRARLRFGPEPARLDPPAAIARTAASLAGGAASNTIQLQAYRVAFPLAGLGATSGAYGIVANVGAAAMSACASIYQQIEAPRLYQSQGRTIGQFVRLAVLLSLGVLAVALGFSSFLIGHLTQPQYLPYALAIGFGVVVEACNLVIGGYGVYMTIHRRTAPLFHLHLLGAVVAVAGCLATLRWSPQSPMLIGAALAGSQLLITPLMGLFVWRHRTGKN
jgi:hypothetical protein